MAELDSETRTHPSASPDRRWLTMVSATLAVAGVVGTILRFWSPSPLWLDEALTVNIAELPFSEMVEALRHDGHPLLYYVLLGWWIDLFGDSDLAVRSLSGVMSLATVPVVWVLARRVDRRTGQVALVLALSSPYLVRYGSETRMYAMTALLVALGWLALLRALESRSRGRLVALALVSAALVHTHYWSFWLIGAVGVMLVVRIVRSPDSPRAARRALAAVIAGSATMVLWIGVLYEQATTTGTPWAGRARPSEVVIEVMQALGGSHRFEGESLGLMLVVLALIGTFAVATTAPRLELHRPMEALTSGAAIATGLTLAIGAVVALVTAGAYEPRYAAVVVPFILVLVARGIVMFPEKWAMSVLVIAVAGGLIVGVDEARRDRTQAGDVASAIDSGADPGDLIVYCPDQVGPATRRELASDLTSVAYPSGTGLFVDWTDYLDRVDSTDPIAFADELSREHADQAIWVVWGQSYRGLEGRCEAIIDTLATARDAVSVIAPSTVFEAMALQRFAARP